MKRRLIKDTISKIVIILVIAFTMFLAIENLDKKTVILVFMLLITGVLVLVGVMIWCTKQLKQIKKLTSEYNTVEIHNYEFFSRFISKEKVQCMAKMDSKGKIHCKVHIDDFEVDMDNYAEFFEYLNYINEDNN